MSQANLTVYPKPPPPQKEDLLSKSHEGLNRDIEEVPPSKRHLVGPWTFIFFQSTQAIIAADITKKISQHGNPPLANNGRLRNWNPPLLIIFSLYSGSIHHHLSPIIGDACLLPPPWLVVSPCAFFWRARFAAGTKLFPP